MQVGGRSLSIKPLVEKNAVLFTLVLAEQMP